MTFRSMGIEFPVDGDPVGLHGFIDEAGRSRWRAECRACGYRSPPYSTPGYARSRAVAHAKQVGHRDRVNTVRP